VHDHELSDTCIIGHVVWLRGGAPVHKVSPQSVLWRALLTLDRKMHFTGVRGAIWRVLGVNRSL
jgi:hypothetical protein